MNHRLPSNERVSAGSTIGCLNFVISHFVSLFPASFLFRALTLQIILVSLTCYLFELVGCRAKESDQTESVHAKGEWPYKVLCKFYPGYEIGPPDNSIPPPNWIPGKKIIFQFGNLPWNTRPYLDDMSGTIYFFEIDSTKSNFAFGATEYQEYKFEKDEFFTTPYGPKRPRQGRIEGKKLNDSTWLMREWVSWDYFEFRRRASYRSKKSSWLDSAGFERICIEKQLSQ